MIGTPTRQNDRRKMKVSPTTKAAAQQKKTKQVIFLSSMFYQVVTKALLYEEG